MDKIIPTFKKTLFDASLGDVLVDMTEMGIDSLLDESVLQSIPIVKLFIGIEKTAQNVHDRNLLRQTIKFINTFNAKTISPDALNSFGTINDSVEYEDQVNNYEFVPDETGLYRFDFSDMMYDTEISFTIYDHLNTPVKKAGVRGEQGLTVDGLTAGEKYKISVSQASGLTQYTISIGRQRAVRSIETGQKISDSIQFVDQRNLYTFVPDETGTYTITGNKSDWNEWYLKAYDENNTPLELENTGDQQVSLELEAGKKYTISCYYREKFIEYSFSIN